VAVVLVVTTLVVAVERAAFPAAISVIRGSRLVPTAQAAAVEVAAVVRTSLLAVLVELAALVALASS
jgi:hypothetical protein